MKTRVFHSQIDIVNLNPFNGWEAEVPDELYVRYLAACRELSCVCEELSEHLIPQAEAVDQAVEQHFARNGLSLLTNEDDQTN